jgi:hypothetical protein
MGAIPSFYKSLSKFLNSNIFSGWRWCPNEFARINFVTPKPVFVIIVSIVGMTSAVPLFQ